MRNRGKLAEGWYGPQMFEKAEAFMSGSPTGISKPSEKTLGRAQGDRHDSGSSEDDILGPALPGGSIATAGGNRQSGPTIPNQQDLALQRGELAATVN